MLFAVKNRLIPTLMLVTIFVAGAFSIRHALDLVWQLYFGPVQLGHCALAVSVVTASNCLLHGTLLLTLRRRYQVRYRALVEYFQPQGVAEILGGGMLAGAEELVFRGVVLEGLRAALNLPSSLAILISAVAFGLLHAIPRWHLLPFALWAIWEGMLLGWVYTLSDMLTVSIVTHAIHDIAGFSLFKNQRSSGWLL